ncbi:hypothetical protein NYE80_31050 [Paenibacillus sp. FSL H7-0357]|nr:hypothetical protein [Paenibacillus sp. FSL H7-0357]
MNNKLSTLVQKMRLEEKASLLNGKDSWSTAPIERFGIRGAVLQ